MPSYRFSGFLLWVTRRPGGSLQFPAICEHRPFMQYSNVMPDLFMYHVHWKHQEKLHVDEFSAASLVAAVDCFNPKSEIKMAGMR